MLIDELLSLFWPSWHRRRHRHRHHRPGPAVQAQVIVTPVPVVWTPALAMSFTPIHGAFDMPSVSLPIGSPDEVASLVYRDAGGNITTLGIPADPVVFSSSDASVLVVTTNADNATAVVHEAGKIGNAQVGAVQGALTATPADVTVTAGPAVTAEVVINPPAA